MEAEVVLVLVFAMKVEMQRPVLSLQYEAWE